MSQKYISFMDTIKRIHAMKNALSCIEFKYDINPYLGYWYAEDRLYLIIDCMVDCYYFIEANSPYDAIAKILKRHEEAEHAGEIVPEVEE